MPDATTNADVEGSTSELVVEAAVVSLSAVFDASARLEGVRRLTVGRRAIVTPAVCDLLRQRKIELYRGERNAKPPQDGAKTATLRLVVGVADASNAAQFETLMKLLGRMPLAIERLAASGLLETIDELARQVAASATVGLLLTPEPAAAMCLANRLPGVRAMAAGDAGTLAALTATAREIGANLLIVDPTGRSPFAMKPWIERFCQGAPRRCPPQWRGRLD
ncbi:MAG TPA: hypothetical protein VHX65_18420 [Pirellulales bacterium]|jgi:hypothetical protein|nr:hypothetical protein [Pirellulales bacterium]